MHYKKWYDEYVSPISAIRPDDGFMTVDGEVCYKLRCAYLHSGNFNLGNGEVVKHIEKFAVHYNRDPELRFIQIAQSTGGKYLLDIDLGVFCWQLCTAATSFDVEVKRSFSAACQQNKKRPSPSTVENSRIQTASITLFSGHFYAKSGLWG